MYKWAAHTYHAELKHSHPRVQTNQTRIMTTIDATILRLALIDYRQRVLQLAKQFPETFAERSTVVKQLDDALLSIEGNVATVHIQPATCNPNR